MNRSPPATLRIRLARLARLGRAVLAVAPLALAGPFASAARAQAPDLPPVIHVVVPFPPGGSNDLAGRVIANQLAMRTGRSVIVDNRAGASGFIGAGVVARAAPDGSMLLCASVSLITAAATKRNVPVDILKDLTTVAILSDAPLVFVMSTDSNIRTPADLVAAARANPNTITNGTPGLGTIAHLSGELLGDIANIKLKHIPYTGGGPALVDLLAGRIDINIVANSTSAGYVAQGKLRPVAISWAQPSPNFPGVMPLASAAPGFDVAYWTAVWAPSGTPAAIVDYLNHEIAEIVKTPEFGALLHDDGGVPQSLPPAAAAAKVQASYDMWRNLAKAKNILVD